MWISLLILWINITEKKRVYAQTVDKNVDNLSKNVYKRLISVGKVYNM